MISDALTLFFETRSLDGNSGVPIYTALQRQILNFIETHSDTTEFPSERELAQLLKINRRTLHKAIEPLIADGTLIRTRKKTLINRNNNPDHQTGVHGAYPEYSAGMTRKIRLLLNNSNENELDFWQKTAKKFGQLFPMFQLEINIPGQNTGNYLQIFEQGEFDLAIMPTYINWKNTFSDQLLPVKESYLKLFDSPDFLSGSWTASVPELRKYAIPWSLSFQILEWNRTPEELFALSMDDLLAKCTGKLPEKMSLFPGYYELSRDLGVPETFTEDIIMSHCNKLLDRFDLASKNDAVFQIRNPDNDTLITRNNYS
ncbi:MAG: GntR family transcriptional regulator [Lentisphaeria bacterium]|nr:GntR family transcriptional regulator [Lentisphaeria bacterium]